MKTITAVIPSHSRPDNIPHILDRVKNQTYKPERIIIWNDNTTPQGRDIVIEDKNVEVINTNSNKWQTFGAYTLGYLTKSDYIAIIDDDYPPAPEWFELCVNRIQEEFGIYAGVGVIVERPDRYKPNIKIKTKVNKDIKIAQVDSCGNTYFIPREAIDCVLRERPPVYTNCFDMHLSVMSQLYGNINTYVPFAERKSQLPIYNDNELPLGQGDFAKWQQNRHFFVRDGYLKRANKRGWKSLRFNEDIRTKYWNEDLL